MRSTWREILDTAMGWVYFLSMYLFFTVLIISGVEIFRSHMDPRIILPVFIRWEVLVLIFSLTVSVFIHLYKRFLKRLFAKAGFIRAFLIYFSAYVVAFVLSMMFAFYVPLFRVGFDELESSVTFVMFLIVIFRATPRHNINDPIGPSLRVPVEEYVKDELKGYGFFNGGVDFPTVYDTPIYAAGDGRVSMAWPYGMSGNLVKIKHDPNFSTAYSHLREIVVERGQEVKKGDLIGFSGNTGHSFQPHLHFEVQYRNRVVDPAKYVEEWKEKGKGKGKGKANDKNASKGHDKGAAKEASKGTDEGTVKEPTKGFNQGTAKEARVGTNKGKGKGKRKK